MTYPIVESKQTGISQINLGSSREAMGLPAHFTRGRLEGFERLLPELMQLGDAALAVELSSAENLKRRLAAGWILALRGDFRLKQPTLIEIPGGAVEIGLEASQLKEVTDRLKHAGVMESWIKKEVPRHIVHLEPYRIGKYPVTNAEYREFLEATEWPELPTSWAFGQYPAERANHPVFSVTPEAADAYCHWLSSATLRRFRLPSEAEWEFAAAGREGLEYPWGANFEAIREDREEREERKVRCNTVESGIHSTTPVGMFPESDSPFGVSDMAGNVEEYVQEDYAPYPGGELISDDLLLSFGRYRVARGGSFTRYRDLARCKRRHGRYAKDIYVMGFRIVEETSK